MRVRRPFAVSAADKARHLAAIAEMLAPFAIAAE